MVATSAIIYINILPVLLLGYNSCITSSAAGFESKQVAKKNEKYAYQKMYGQVLAAKMKT